MRHSTLGVGVPAASHRNRRLSPSFTIIGCFNSSLFAPVKRNREFHFDFSSLSLCSWTILPIIDGGISRSFVKDPFTLTLYVLTPGCPGVPFDPGSPDRPRGPAIPTFRHILFDTINLGKENY